LNNYKIKATLFSNFPKKWAIAGKNAGVGIELGRQVDCGLRREEGRR